MIRRVVRPAWLRRRASEPRIALPSISSLPGPSHETRPKTNRRRVSSTEMWPYRELTRQTLLGALALTAIGIAWFGLASLIGGWVQTVMIAMFGALVLGSLIVAKKRRSDQWGAEWERGGSPDDSRS